MDMAGGEEEEEEVEEVEEDEEGEVIADSAVLVGRGDDIDVCVKVFESSSIVVDGVDELIEMEEENEAGGGGSTIITESSEASESTVNTDDDVCLKERVGSKVKVDDDVDVAVGGGSGSRACL